MIRCRSLLLLVLAGASSEARAQTLLAVVEKHADSIGIYDPATGARVDRVSVGVRPHEIALSQDGRLAYVTNYGVERWTQADPGGHTISIVDLHQARLVGDIDLGAFRRPHGIAMSEGGRLYVVTDLPAALLEIDPVARHVLRSVPIGQSLPHMVAVTRDGRKAYTANAGAGTVTAVSLTANQTLAHIDVGGVPMGLALSGDERRLYTVNRTGNEVLLIDTATDTIVKRASVAGQPVRCLLTPDGASLIVTLIETGEVAVLAADTLREIQRFRAGTSAEGIAIDAAGRRLYVSAQGEDVIVVYTLGSWQPVLRIPTGARPDPMAFFVRPPPIQAGSSRPPTPPVYGERDGVVSIEAELATDNVGAWEEVEGRNAMENQYGSSPDHRVVVRDPVHPLADGLSGEVALPANTWTTWGIAGPRATVAVTVGHDVRKAVVFGYEAGAPMASGAPAPARRVFTPMPDAAVPAFGRWLAAAARWAAPAHAGERHAVVLTNDAEPVEAERAVARALESSRFAVTFRVATAIQSGDRLAPALVVVPSTVRTERIHGCLIGTAAPVLVAGKGEVARELGLTLPPRPSPAGANAVLIRPGPSARWTDHLRYVIHFTTAGEYRIWLLGQSGGSAGSNEAKIFFDRQPDPRSDDFFEMRLDHEPGWISRATARRPGDRKTPVAAVVRVDRPGWHELFVVKGSEPEHHPPGPPPSYRFPNWRLDKIVLARAADFTPTGDGPDTTAGAAAGLPPAGLLAQHEFRPRQVWPVRDGSVVIEAEEIDHHPHWVEAKTPDGFTGSSFLEWRGPRRSRSIEGLGGNDDHLHVRQGAPEEWLIVRLDVDRPGVYRVDVRNHHRDVDGDNDVWIGRPGLRATRDRPIVRMGDSLRDGPGFSWLDWGVGRVELEAGMNELYVGGRSIGFGIDRIVLYAAGDERAKARALDPATEAARPRLAGEAAPTAPDGGR